jgi:4-amino-4-deoxy-L-arabinose transferase-like glycosyltransferase
MSRERATLWAYRLFPLLLLPVMLVLSRDYGITWDEKTHQMYGEAVWLWRTQGADSHWFRPHWFMYLHGGLADALGALAERLWPGDPWTARHLLNVLFGWIGILYTGRIGRLVQGPATGLLAMVLLVLSPRFFADCMNNPKDVPFAAFATAALYYTLRLRPAFPFLKARLFVPLALALALAMNVRSSGALLALAYVALALFVLALAARERRPARLAANAGVYALLVVVVLVLGTSFWPWAQKRPLERTWQGALALSKFVWIHPVLYDGRDIPATSLPWHYVPRWMAMSLPPVVLLGALAALRLLRRAGRERALVAGLLFAALFPPLYIVARHATIYDGIRHLLFAYPPLVALAACGWAALLREPRQAVRVAAAGALAAGLLEPAVFMWRDHPNQAVYFNALAGGPRAALGRYELDYWANSARQGLAWADALARERGVRLVVAGHPPHVVRDEARRHLHLEYARPQAGRHQLEVIVLRGPRADVMELAARTDALHRVTTADGTPLAIVVPGPAWQH